MLLTALLEKKKIVELEIQQFILNLPNKNKSSWRINAYKKTLATIERQILTCVKQL